MSDRPNKEQMMKIVVPGVAIAVVLVLVGLLIAMNGDPEKPKESKKSPSDPNIVNPSLTPGGSELLAGNDEGMVSESPSADSSEWVEIGNGLKTWDVTVGDGEPCPPGAFVSMHYAGWLLSGKLFDSSRASLKPERGEPLNMSLGGLIAGWQKGVPGMKRGGIRRLYIPYQMAYGESGSPGGIPPKADLIFEIKLIDYK